MQSLRGLFIYLALILLIFKCDKENNVVGFVIAQPNAPEDVPEDENLEITFDEKVFREIKPGVLVVVNSSALAEEFKFNCVTKRDIHVDWKYKTIGENVVDLQPYQNEIYLNTSEYFTGPPVARLECLNKEATVSSSVLLYRGNGTPPFLHNYGKQVEANIATDETTAELPCLLNYPIDNSSQYELQLHKDGIRLKNHNLFEYIPELGFKLDLTALKEPYGRYECKVINSDNDDFVTVDLHEDDVTKSGINVKHISDLTSFYSEDPQKFIFQCRLSRSKFQQKMDWFYKLKNGTLIPANPEVFTGRSPSTIENPSRYLESVKLSFFRNDIGAVICVGHSMDNRTYNSTYPVKVLETSKPDVKYSPSDHPIVHIPTAATNLTCESTVLPVKFSWFQDNNLVNGLSTSSESAYKSTLHLNPAVKDVNSNYTCVLENFHGNASHTFRVVLRQNVPHDPLLAVFVAVGICIAALTIILMLVFACFRVNMKRRRFSKALVKQFFHGKPRSQNPANDYVKTGSIQDSLEHEKYDYSKEIKKDCLKFGNFREVIEGHFGKVEFGYHIDKNTGRRTPVAIKSIKRDDKASQEDLNDAFARFLQEIKLAQSLGNHRNVVRYIGAVTAHLSNYSAYLVVEYCVEGDLASYLRNFKSLGGSFDDDIQNLHHDEMSEPGSGESVLSMSGVVLKTTHLMKWCEDIAAGLEYISSKKWVHRDIAARNILLALEGSESVGHPDPGMLTAKISDFGLSKDLIESQKDYYSIIVSAESNRKLELPLRWMSVETLETLKFTTFNDVWAFGVTMWEIFSFGKYPYADIVNDNIDLREKLVRYFRMGSGLPQPDLAPPEIWDLIQDCMELDPSDRPTFLHLKDTLHSVNETLANAVAEMEDDEEGNEEANKPRLADSGYSTVTSVQNMNYDYNFGEEYDSEEQNDDNESDLSDSNSDLSQHDVQT